MDARLESPSAYTTIMNAYKPILAAKSHAIYDECNPVHFIFDCISRLSVTMANPPADEKTLAATLRKFQNEMDSLLERFVIIRISNPSIRCALMETIGAVDACCKVIDEKSNAKQMARTSQLLELKKMQPVTKSNLVETLFTGQAQSDSQSKPGDRQQHQPISLFK